MAVNVNRVKVTKCCQPIKMDTDLELDLFWHSMHRGPVEGGIYIKPNALRFIFSEDASVMRDLQRIVEDIYQVL